MTDFRMKISGVAVKAGGNGMDKPAAHEIIERAIGLKRWEWNRIVAAVNQKFDTENARLEMTKEMADGAKRLIDLEE